MTEETSIENTAPEAEVPGITPAPAAIYEAEKATPVLTAHITRSVLDLKGWELADWIVSLQKEADEKGVIIASVDFDRENDTFHYEGFATPQAPTPVDGANL